MLAEEPKRRGIQVGREGPVGRSDVAIEEFPVRQTLGNHHLTGMVLERQEPALVRDGEEGREDAVGNERDEPGDPARRGGRGVRVRQHVQWARRLTARGRRKADIDPRI